MSIPSSNATPKVQSYKRHIDLTDAIRQILNDYPLGSGIIRELIQNSDDAEANSQILILDARSFGASTLLDPALARYQGPALLAFNDQLFSEEDWTSLMSISHSAKKDDISKAGKFGLGFNAVYHITDAPSIISGQWLTLFDVHEDLSDYPGGAKVDFTGEEQALQLGDQLAAFTSVLDGSSFFNGTVVRLPLRTVSDASRSRIKKEETSVTSIRNLILSFIQNELDISLLFLKHLKLLEFRVVLETGEQRTLARAELLDCPEKRPSVASDHANFNELQQLRVHVATHEGHNTTHEWLVRYEVGDLGSLDADNFPAKAETLKGEKLYPHVALALPLSRQLRAGRLFTYLPLPIVTELPVHVHALFALTSDRQSLRNSSEKAEPGSREHVLQSWNAYLFQELIARAWANILNDAKALVDNVHVFWPLWTDASADWKSIGAKILTYVLRNNLPIWRLHCPHAPSAAEFSRFDEALIVVSYKLDNDLLSALAKADIRIIRPPGQIVQSIENMSGYTRLTPGTVAQYFQSAPSPRSLESLSTAEKMRILYYLCEPQEYNLLLGVPFIPLTNGTFVALSEPTGDAEPNPTSVYLATPEEISLFHSYEPRFIDLSLIEKTLESGYTRTIVESLRHTASHTNARHFGLEHGCDLVHVACMHQVDVGWLSSVHAWADSNRKRVCAKRSKFIDQLPLPLNDGSTRPAQSEPLSLPIMDARSLKEDALKMFQELGIPLLHMEFTPTQYLRDTFSVSTTTDTGVLLNWLDTVDVVKMTPVLRPILHEQLSRALQIGHFSSRLADLRRILGRLPVFRVAMPSISRSPSEVYVSFGDARFYVVDQSLKVLPILSRHNFLDISRESNARLIRALEPEARLGTPLQLAELAADNLGSQPEYLIDDVFEELIMPHIYSLWQYHPTTFKKLQSTPFVTTHTGRRAPAFLLDPRDKIRHLFSDEEAVFPTGIYAETRVLGQLSASVGPFFGIRVGRDMIDERINKYTRNGASPETIRCAERLLDIIDGLDHTSSVCEFPPSVGQKPWIPVDGQLVDASSARDASYGPLASHVLFILPRNLRNHNLRKTLGWSADLPNEILQRQFLALIEELPSSDTVAALHSVLPAISEQFTVTEVERLRTVVGNRGWLPIRHDLRPAHSVYLSDDIRDLDPSFVKLPDSLRPLSLFLARMGVPEVPTLEYLLLELRNLARDVASPSRLDRSIHLLEAICVESQPDAFHTLILVPDETNDLRPATDIVFDDRGQHEELLNISRTYAHPRVSQDLASRLGLVKASSLLVEGLADDDAFTDYEQYEAFRDKISNTLLGYTYISTCNEVLANADDAGATEVSILYDQRVFSETGTLSPRLHDIHRGPALVIHNNGVFTESDWKGLREVGVGGKVGKESIGRFGLGALTFYHWTDVPLIVSGDYALILDPSGEYLPEITPGQRRRGLKINLRRCSDAKMDGTLEPLIGLCGFDSRTHYKGTLIRLPLRHSSSKLLNATYNKAPVITKFLSHCIDNAQMAFLFTKHLHSITVGEKHDAHGSSARNTVIKGTRRPLLCAPVRDYPGFVGDITSSLITVSQVGKSESSFLVVKSKIPTESLPLDPPIRQCARKHRLSSPSVGFACPLGAHRSAVVGQMCLMSTFPIDITQFPVHVHGEFILSSERTTILMHRISGVSPETQYNEYLLGQLAPPAYLYLIHICLQQRFSTPRLWPNVEHGITETLAKATYDLLPQFPSVLFETTPTKIHPKTLVSPKDAVFNYYSCLTATLQRLNVPNLVNANNHGLSPDLCPSLHFDDAAWVKELVRDNGGMLQRIFQDRSFSKQFVGDLISHIMSTSGPPNLHGLCLLPTVAGLHTFQHAGDIREAFLVPSHEEEKLFFFARERFFSRVVAKEKFFFHEDIMKILLASAELNVRRIMPEVDVYPIMSHAFPPAQGPVHTTKMKTTIPHGQHRTWLSSFRDYIIENKVPAEGLRSLPFIPLSHPKDTYISAESSNESFAVEGSASETQLSEAILRLKGFHTFIRWSDLPPDLVPQPTLFNLPLFLRWLAVYPNSWLSLDDATQKTLAKEVRSQLEFSSEHVALNASSPLVRIPIWECISPNGIVVLKAAIDLVVLPSFPDVPTVDARYLVQGRNYVCLTGKLREISKVLLATVVDTSTDLSRVLILPEHLDTTQIASFTDLLQTLRKHAHGFRHHRLAPDGALRLRLASHLFNPEIEVFVNSLYPSQLLHPSFLSETEWFIPLGLRATLNAENIRECAVAVDRAVHDPSVTNASERATQLYTYLLGAPTFLSDQYRDFERLSFIQRQSDERFTAWRRPHLPDLDPVLPPSQLLLSQYIPVAWTQRGAFATEPSPDLCTLWPTLGKPPVDEVVQHLLVLTRVVARDVENTYASNNAFIQDLRQTYEHLQEQIPEDVRSALSEHGETRLFLNVENSQSRPWDWASADGLVLDTDHDIPSQNLIHVKCFLHPYTNLLQTAGVRRINPVDPGNLRLDNDLAETYPQNLLEGMAEILDQNSGEDLTDVTLVAMESETRNEIRAHRIVLAAASDYFRGLFCAGFQRRERAELDTTFTTLRIIIDYIYNRDTLPEFVPTENIDQEAEYIEILLHVLVAADRYMLPALKQIIEHKLLANGRFIHVPTTPQILKYAKLAHSDVVAQVCEDFMRENTSYFDASHFDVSYFD